MAKPAAKRTPKARKTGKAFGESLSDFPVLTEAERRLIDSCTTGNGCVLGDEVPKRQTAANAIRPELIRFLALGGDNNAPVHPAGVRLQGAWISGRLDLDSCRCHQPLLLTKCRIDGDFVAFGAELSHLSLAGSHIDGFEGDGLKVRGSVFLRNGFKAEGHVRLLGTHIGGDVDCGKGTFAAEDGNALNCDRAVISGSVFFTDGFEAKGQVRLLGVNIGGNLDCKTGFFNAKDGKALNCDGTVIAGALYFRKVAAVMGAVDFTACTTGLLSDDTASWGKVPSLSLNGFRYGRIGNGPTDAATRIAWLQTNQLVGTEHEFWPQPWEQLIKVLREMGHEEDAKLVAMAKQDEMRARGKIRGVAWPFHWLFGWLAGYGYRPLRTVGAMLLVMAVCAEVYDYANEYGWMGPTSAIVQTDRELAEACGTPQDHRLTTWTICPKLPNEYTTFNPLLYSLDLILPFVNLQQEQDWSPLVTINGTEWDLPRAFIRFVMWFEILFGWGASLLLAAVLSNLPKRD